MIFIEWNDDSDTINTTIRLVHVQTVRDDNTNIILFLVRVGYLLVK